MRQEPPLTGLVRLTPFDLCFALIAVFLARLVRGCSGFAPSALIMAFLTRHIAPLELIRSAPHLNSPPPFC